MWIDEAYRGRGYARALLNAFAAEACSRGVRRIWVASYDFQAPGVYEKAGFKRMAEFQGWPEGHTNVVLCKTLSSREGLNPRGFATLHRSSGRPPTATSEANGTNGANGTRLRLALRQSKGSYTPGAARWDASTLGSHTGCRVSLMQRALCYGQVKTDLDEDIPFISIGTRQVSGH
jgi:hypothetical protein